MRNKGIKKNVDNIFYKLLEIAEHKKINILTNFRGSKSVLWNLRSQKILLINEKISVKEKLNILCEVLRNECLEDIYIKPYIREMISSYSKDNLAQKKVLICEICNRPIASESTKLAGVCSNCFKFQVKYGMDLSGCKKQKTDRECMACPAFDNCKIVIKQLYPFKTEEELETLIEEKRNTSHSYRDIFYKYSRYYRKKSNMDISGR